MADKRISITELDERTWEDLGHLAHHDGACFIDISGVERVTPGGVVALLLMTLCRRRRWTIIKLPKRGTKAINHLKRINLVHLVRVWGNARFEGPENYAATPGPSSRSAFTQTLISESPDYDSVFDLMTRYFEDAYPEDCTRLKTVFTELLNNITDHAEEGNRKPFYCIQMHALPNGLQLSFGDLGMGFKASLALNPTLPAFQTEAEALHGANVDELSSMSHLNPGRGGGLRRALNTVTELGGSYRVLSHDGVASISAGPVPTFGSLAQSFPVTMAWFDLPRSSTRK